VLILEGAVAYNMVIVYRIKFVCMVKEWICLHGNTLSFATVACHARYCGFSLNRAVHPTDCAVMFIYTSFYDGLAQAYI
jgi:hypothetical protein